MTTEVIEPLAHGCDPPAFRPFSLIVAETRISFYGAMRWSVKTFSTRASEMFAAWLRNGLEVEKKKRKRKSE